MRFLHSHSAHESFDVCRARFELSQTGAPRDNEALNFKFGRTFHRFAELYRNHCIANERWSDVEVMPALIDQAFREIGLSTRHYEEMTMLCQFFVSNERIDIERSLMREGGVALDADFNLIPWSEEFDYDSPNFKAAGSRAAVRAKMDEVLVDPSLRLLIVDDWKSDYYVPSPTEINDPSSRWYKQSHLYAFLAARYLYPDALSVEFRFKFVRWNMKRIVTITRDEIDEYALTFKRRVAFIEATDEFPAIPGDHCRTCPFLRGACPIAQQAQTYAQSAEQLAAEYIRNEALREQTRELLKEMANESGTIEIGGLPVLIFEKDERRVLDVAKVLDALRAEGIEAPELMLDASASKLERVLDADQFTRVMAAASSTSDDTAAVVFNVHQSKPQLVALAERFGIPNPQKMKVAALALAIVKATSQKAA
jgi:hypothetical protein